MSDLTAIIVVLSVIVAFVVSAILLTRYVKAKMKLEDENRKRFALEHGFELHADKSLSRADNDLAISFRHVYLLDPGTGMGEGQGKYNAGQIEMVQIEATYPASYQWFACEERAGKPYVDNERKPTTWIDYHKDQLDIPRHWRQIPIDDGQFGQHYVVFSEGERFPEFENREAVLRWLWTKSTYFVCARDGKLTIWIPALEITGDAESLFETLERALNHTLSICSPH